MMLLERIVTLFLNLLIKIEQKRTSINQLRTLLFGESKSAEAKKENDDSEQTQAESKQTEPAASEPKPKRKGHGRQPASACTGAKVVHCQHSDFIAIIHRLFAMKGNHPSARPAMIRRCFAARLARRFTRPNCPMACHRRSSPLLLMPQS
jgi:hypothetical protein